MKFSEFVVRAMETDRTDKTDRHKAFHIGLHGIAGEAGSVVSEAKKCFRAGEMAGGVGGLPAALRDGVREELGDLLWYIAFIAYELDLNLDDVAAANLKKVQEFWSEELPELPDYDDHPHDDQKLPRHMLFKFEEDDSGDIPRVRMIPKGGLADRFNKRAAEQRRRACQIGDDLDDNATQADGYRYHDIIHLAHATVLGWSPVLRALMGAQRRSVDDCDRVQDGARAKAIEEGLAALVFNYLEPYDLSSEYLDWNLFKHVRRTVRGLEVASQPVSAWRHAYTQAFKIFLELRDNRGGTVECDLDSRELAFSG